MLGNYNNLLCIFAIYGILRTSIYCSIIYASEYRYGADQTFIAEGVYAQLSIGDHVPIVVSPQNNVVRNIWGEILNVEPTPQVELKVYSLSQ